MADPPQSRLTPAEALRAGFKRTSRRYAPTPILEAWRAGAAVLNAPIETISHRAYENARNALRFGAPISREKVTKELTAGRAPYRSERAKEQADYMRRTRPFNVIEHLTRADRRSLDNWKNKGQKLDLRPIFDRYPRKQVLNALGSPERNSHSRKFRFAA